MSTGVARQARQAAARSAAFDRGGRIVAPPAALQGRDEAVLKLISSTRSRASAGRMVWYVGRVRPQDRDDVGTARVRLHDESGVVVSRAAPSESFADTRAATRQAFAGLALTPEADNLKRARQHRGAAIATDDLRHSVAHHLAFSVRLREPGEAAAAETACAAAAREVFGGEGYRCLWAMHDAEVAGAGDGHNHVHFHMIVKAGHEFGGPRLRFGAGGG